MAIKIPSENGRVGVYPLCDHGNHSNAKELFRAEACSHENYR